MDTNSVSPITSAGNLMVAQAEFGMKVFRKSLDIETAQAAQLIQMMSQQTGVGQTVDTTA